MENFDRIQNYLLDNMSPSERIRFEEEVKQDDTLAEQLELQRFELETLDQLEEDSLRSLAKKIDLNSSAKQNEETNIRSINTQRSATKRWLTFAAAASVLLLIGFFLFNQNTPNTANIMAYGYENASIEYQDLRRGDNDETQKFDPEILSILQTRNKAKAKQAIQYFSSITPINPKIQNEAKLNLAHAYILNKEHDKAINLLNDVENAVTFSNRKKEEIQFTKALAYIGLNDNSNALSILNQIIKKNNRFSPLAKKILEMIEQ